MLVYQRYIQCTHWMKIPKRRCWKKLHVALKTTRRLGVIVPRKLKNPSCDFFCPVVTWLPAPLGLGGRDHELEIVFHHFLDHHFEHQGFGVILILLRQCKVKTILVMWHWGVSWFLGAIKLGPSEWVYRIWRENPRHKMGWCRWINSAFLVTRYR